MPENRTFSDRTDRCMFYRIRATFKIASVLQVHTYFCFWKGEMGITEEGDLCLCVCVCGGGGGEL